MSTKSTDAGYKSRKFLSYLFSSLMIVTVGLAMGPDRASQVIFGLVSALGLYLGGNVSQDWVQRAKPHIVPSVKKPPEEEGS